MKQNKCVINRFLHWILGLKISSKKNSIVFQSNYNCNYLGAKKYNASGVMISIVSSFSSSYKIATYEFYWISIHRTKVDQLRTRFIRLKYTQTHGQTGKVGTITKSKCLFVFFFFLDLIGKPLRSTSLCFVHSLMNYEQFIRFLLLAYNQNVMWTIYFYRSVN